MINYINFSVLKSEIDQCQRLFHGRGKAYEGLSHVTVDWLPPVVLITVYQEEEFATLQGWGNDLREHIPGCRSIQVRYRCRPKTPYEVIWGESVQQLSVNENGLQYLLELGRSQNTGLFLDMANGRSWVRGNASNKRILNLFSYTCGFSVAALAGGASHVVNIDVSKASLSKGRENHRLNGQDLKKVTYEAVDIFKSYSRLKKHGPYDLLICDPPQFQKGRVDIKRDYAKIIRRLPKFMNAGGQLMLCLNSPELDIGFLNDIMTEESPGSQFVESVAPPEVFVDVEPGKGLKVLVYQFFPHN